MDHVLAASTIERLLGVSGDDRRGKKRFSAADVCAVAAPYVTTPLPGPDDLCPVECQNLSRRGIAFLWAGNPTARFMLIGLGQAPDTIYLTARIAGTTRVPGDTRFLVRCQFLRKVDL